MQRYIIRRVLTMAPGPLGLAITVFLVMRVHDGDAASAVTVAAASPSDILSAVKQHTVGDYLGHSIGIIALSIPNFWLGTLTVVPPPVRRLVAGDDAHDLLGAAAGAAPGLHPHRPRQGSDAAPRDPALRAAQSGYGRRRGPSGLPRVPPTGVRGT